MIEPDPMIKPVAIDHVVLRMNQMPAILRFYCEIVGCVEERRIPEAGLVQLWAGDSLIDLLDVAAEQDEYDHSAPSMEAPNMAHLCLRIAAVEESDLRTCLEQAGITTQDFADRYGATGYGRSLYIRDPQGNVVELKLEPIKAVLEPEAPNLLLQIFCAISPPSIQQCQFSSGNPPVPTLYCLSGQQAEIPIRAALQQRIRRLHAQLVAAERS